MKKNMGLVDKIVRITIAAIVVILFFTNILTGVLGIVLLILSGVFLLTSSISFCPLYTLFGLKTCKNSK